MDEIIKGKVDFDVVSHYTRSDVFQLIVNEEARKPVTYDHPKNNLSR